MSKPNPVELMLEDAANAQRSRGLIPKLNDARQYIAGIVEKVERQSEENRLRIKPAPPPAPEKRTLTDRTDEELNDEFKKRAARFGHDPLPGSWTITKGGDTPERKRTALRKGDKLLAARIRLIRNDPEWWNRAKTINPLAMSGQLGPEEQKHATQLWWQLIEASERKWGPWHKPAVKPLYSLPTIKGNDNAE